MWVYDITVTMLECNHVPVEAQAVMQQYNCTKEYEKNLWPDKGTFRIGFTSENRRETISKYEIEEWTMTVYNSKEDVDYVKRVQELVNREVMCEHVKCGKKFKLKENHAQACKCHTREYEHFYRDPIYDDEGTTEYRCCGSANQDAPPCAVTAHGFSTF